MTRAGVLGAVVLGTVLMVFSSRIGAAAPCCGHRDCSSEIKQCIAAGTGTHKGCTTLIIGECRAGTCHCTNVSGCPATDGVCSPSGAFLDLE